jgi:hypothetical protein|tara:strand:+ start:219 stop:368 length:150 start_codon:yes stop_codon:yes gene_type:complete
VTQDKVYNDVAFVAVIYGLFIWLPSGIVNYIMVGKFRILPWKKITEDSK